MNYLIILLTFTLLIGELCRATAAASFDQRQMGDLNVQIDLKNFKIFALTKGKEEYVDYDYAYDYSEMTIKPQNGITTIKPLSTSESAQTVKDNTTVTQLVGYDVTTKMENNASITTEKAIITTDSTIVKASSDAVETTIIPHAATSYRTGTIAINTSSTEATSPRLQENNDTLAEFYNNTSYTICKKGYYRNSKGDCELSLQNPSFNILLKMLQKSKSSSGNGDKKS